MNKLQVIILLLGVVGSNDPCPGMSKRLKLDRDTSFYICGDFIQLRVPTRSVSFSMDQWMRIKYGGVNQAMGLFQFEDVFIKVGRPKKITISEKDSKGITLTAEQWRKFLIWIQSSC